MRDYSILDIHDIYYYSWFYIYKFRIVTRNNIDELTTHPFELQNAIQLMRLETIDRMHAKNAKPR